MSFSKWSVVDTDGYLSKRGLLIIVFSSIFVAIFGTFILGGFKKHVTTGIYDHVEYITTKCDKTNYTIIYFKDGGSLPCRYFVKIGFTAGANLKVIKQAGSDWCKLVANDPAKRILETSK